MSLNSARHSTSSVSEDDFEPFDEKLCRQKLRKIGRTSDQIKRTAGWIFHHRNYLSTIVRFWLSEFKKATPVRRLNLYYVAHETLALCKKKRFDNGFTCFQSVLREATVYSRDKECKKGVCKVFSIFKEAAFYPDDFLKLLSDDLRKGKSMTNFNKHVLADFDPGVIAKIHEQMEEFTERTLKVAEEIFEGRKNFVEYGDHVISKIKDHGIGKERLAAFDEGFEAMKNLDDAREQDLQHHYDLLNQLELLRIHYSVTSKEAEKVIVAYGNYEAVAHRGMTHLTKVQGLLDIPIPSQGAGSQEVTDMDMSDDEEQPPEPVTPTVLPPPPPPFSLPPPGGLDFTALLSSLANPSLPSLPVPQMQNHFENHLPGFPSQSAQSLQKNFERSPDQHFAAQSIHNDFEHSGGYSGGGGMISNNNFEQFPPHGGPPIFQHHPLTGNNQNFNQRPPLMGSGPRQNGNLNGPEMQNFHQSRFPSDHQPQNFQQFLPLIGSPQFIPQRPGFFPPYQERNDVRHQAPGPNYSQGPGQRSPERAHFSPALLENPPGPPRFNSPQRPPLLAHPPHQDTEPRRSQFDYRPPSNFTPNSPNFDNRPSNNFAPSSPSFDQQRMRPPPFEPPQRHLKPSFEPPQRHPQPFNEQHHDFGSPQHQQYFNDEPQMHFDERKQESPRKNFDSPTNNIRPISVVHRDDRKPRKSRFDEDDFPEEFVAEPVPIQRFGGPKKCSPSITGANTVPVTPVVSRRLESQPEVDLTERLRRLAQGNTSTNIVLTDPSSGFRRY